MGRPSTLTPELQTEFIKCLQQGNYASTCCHSLGIPEGTYANWINKGNKAQSGRFKEFSVACKKARAKAIRGYVDVIKKAADEGVWQAAAWYLERTQPKFYGRVNRVEMDSKSEIKVTEDDGIKAILNDPELSQIATELLTRVDSRKKER